MSAPMRLNTSVQPYTHPILFCTFITDLQIVGSYGYYT